MRPKPFNPLKGPMSAPIIAGIVAQIINRLFGPPAQPDEDMTGIGRLNERFLRPRTDQEGFDDPSQHYDDLRMRKLWPQPPYPGYGIPAIEGQPEPRMRRYPTVPARPMEYPQGI